MEYKVWRFISAFSNYKTSLNIAIIENVDNKFMTGFKWIPDYIYENVYTDVRINTDWVPTMFQAPY